MAYSSYRKDSYSARHLSILRESPEDMFLNGERSEDIYVNFDESAFKIQKAALTNQNVRPNKPPPPLPEMSSTFHPGNPVHPPVPVRTVSQVSMVAASTQTNQHQTQQRSGASTHVPDILAFTGDSLPGQMGVAAGERVLWSESDTFETYVVKYIELLHDELSWNLAAKQTDSYIVTPLTDMCRFDMRRNAEKEFYAMLNKFIDPSVYEHYVRIFEHIQQIRNYCETLRVIAHYHSLTELNNYMDYDPIDAASNVMKMSFNEFHRRIICNLGGLEALAQLIVMNSQVLGESTTNYHFTLRRYVCMALTNLTFGIGPNKAFLCSNDRVMSTLIQFISSSCEEVKQVAASVVRNLSWKADDTIKDQLRNAKIAIALTAESMKCAKESCLKAMLSALWNISSHSVDNKVAICSVPGGIDFFCDVIGYKTVPLVENSGGILRNISPIIASNVVYRQKIRDNCAYNILLRNLRSPSLTVVGNSCGTLSNLVSVQTSSTSPGSTQLPDFDEDRLQDLRLLWELGAVAMMRSLIQSRHRTISVGAALTLKALLSARTYLNISDAALQFALTTSSSSSSSNSSTTSLYDDGIQQQQMPQNLFLGRKLSALQSDIENVLATVTNDSNSEHNSNANISHVATMSNMGNHDDLSLSGYSTDNSIGHHSDMTHDRPKGSNSMLLAQPSSNNSGSSNMGMSLSGYEMKNQNNVKSLHNPHDSLPMNHCMRMSEMMLENTTTTTSSIKPPSTFSRDTGAAHQVMNPMYDYDSDTSEKPQDYSIQFCDDNTEEEERHKSAAVPVVVDCLVASSSPSSVSSGSSSGLVAPLQEQPRVYATEGTPRDRASPVETAAAATQKKSVSFTRQPRIIQDVTPLMFSRNSSIASLDSFEIHSVHSSIPSEYSNSRRTSEMVSPSDLPASPGDEMLSLPPNTNDEVVRDDEDESMPLPPPPPPQQVAHIATAAMVSMLGNQKQKEEKLIKECIQTGMSTTISSVSKDPMNHTVGMVVTKQQLSNQNAMINKAAQYYKMSSANNGSCTFGAETASHMEGIVQYADEGTPFNYSTKASSLSELSMAEEDNNVQNNAARQQQLDIPSSSDSDEQSELLSEIIHAAMPKEDDAEPLDAALPEVNSSTFTRPKKNSSTASHQKPGKFYYDPVLMMLDSPRQYGVEGTPSSAISQRNSVCSTDALSTGVEPNLPVTCAGPPRPPRRTTSSLPTASCDDALTGETAGYDVQRGDVVVYMTEDTPADYSRASPAVSHSCLLLDTGCGDTKDGEDSLSPPLSGGDVPGDDSPRGKTATETGGRSSRSGDDKSSLSSLSIESAGLERTLLQQCISSAMPTPKLRPPTSYVGGIPSATNPNTASSKKPSNQASSNNSSNNSQPKNSLNTPSSTSSSSVGGGGASSTKKAVPGGGSLTSVRPGTGIQRPTPVNGPSKLPTSFSARASVSHSNSSSRAGSERSAPPITKTTSSKQASRSADTDTNATTTKCYFLSNGYVAQDPGGSCHGKEKTEAVALKNEASSKLSSNKKKTVPVATNLPSKLTGNRAGSLPSSEKNLSNTSSRNASPNSRSTEKLPSTGISKKGIAKTGIKAPGSSTKNSFSNTTTRSLNNKSINNATSKGIAKTPNSITKSDPKSSTTTAPNNSSTNLKSSNIKAPSTTKIQPKSIQKPTGFLSPSIPRKSGLMAPSNITNPRSGSLGRANKETSSVSGIVTPGRQIRSGIVSPTSSIAKPITRHNNTAHRSLATKTTEKGSTSTNHKGDNAATGSGTGAKRLSRRSGVFDETEDFLLSSSLSSNDDVENDDTDMEIDEIDDEGGLQLINDGVEAILATLNLQEEEEEEDQNPVNLSQCIANNNINQSNQNSNLTNEPKPATNNGPRIVKPTANSKPLCKSTNNKSESDNPTNGSDAIGVRGARKALAGRKPGTTANSVTAMKASKLTKPTSISSTTPRCTTTALTNRQYKETSVVKPNMNNNNNMVNGNSNAVIKKQSATKKTISKSKQKSVEKTEENNNQADNELNSSGVWLIRNELCPDTVCK